MATDSYLRSNVPMSLVAGGIFHLNRASGRIVVRSLKCNGFAVILLAINQSFHQLIS